MLKYDVVKNWKIPDVFQEIGLRDANLYALGIGFGSRPLAPLHLRYAYKRGAHIFPTMAVVLSRPGLWMNDPRTGIDVVKLLHAEQDLEILWPIPVQARIRSESRIVAVVDKGKAIGALMYAERLLYEDHTNTLLAKARHCSMLRADGGFSEVSGQGDEPPPAVPTMPAELGPPDAVVVEQIPACAALLYRLCGDDNPIHSDPLIAARAGFAAPVLHGLCTYGNTARILVERFAPDGRLQLRRFGARFSSPVFPGDRLECRFWKIDDRRVRFEAAVPARNVTVLKAGIAELHEFETPHE